MSAEAHRWLSLNLRDIRDMSYEEINKTTGKTKVRYLGEDGLALLVYLCDSVNRKTGTFYMTAQTMCEETGIAAPRTVYRLLGAFQSWGWITPMGEKRYHGRGRPTTEYHLSCVYGEPKPVPQDTRKGVFSVPPTDEQLSQGTHENSMKPNKESISSKQGDSYPYPYPEPDPKPEPDTHAAPQQKGQGGKDEFVEMCVQLDLANYPPRETPGRGLTNKLRREYEPLAVEALRQYPEAKPGDLAIYCTEKKHGKKPTPYLLAELKPNNCETCRGALVVPGQAYRDEHDNWVNPGNTPCPECRPQNVTQIDTRKRVNTSTNTYTDIPGGTPTADTLLPVADLARHFTR